MNGSRAVAAARPKQHALRDSMSCPHPWSPQPVRPFARRVRLDDRVAVRGQGVQPGSGGCLDAGARVGAAWPGERLVLEADPSGGDALFRLAHADGGLLHPEPTLLSLTADARTGLDPTSLPAYAQPTSLGVPVVLAPPTPEAFALTGPRVAAARRGRGAVGTAWCWRTWGACTPGTRPPPPCCRCRRRRAGDRADVAGLYRLRERVAGLAAQLAPAPGRRRGYWLSCGRPRSQRRRAWRRSRHCWTRWVHPRCSPGRCSTTIAARPRSLRAATAAPADSRWACCARLSS